MRYNRLYKDNHYLTATTNTQDLSEYVENLKYEDLPAEVVERAKMILLHTAGAVLAAKDTGTAAKVLKMAREANGGEGGATTVWGAGGKMAAVNSALVLGTLAEALDWGDCSWTGHPAAGVIPCAWLAAEERHRSGRDLITAIVAGYEIYQRIALAVQPSEERWNARGWGLTSWQIFGCIIPIAKLYGMDARKINQSIGMGCECSTLPTSYHEATMSDFGHYEYGYRARDGFLIAKSVDKGIHNQRDALDEPRCYTGVICGNDGSNGASETLIRSGEADLTWLTRDLGRRYLILETLLKPWPADIWAQVPVEMVHQLAVRHGFGAEDVEEVLVDAPVLNRMWAPEGEFTSAVHAQRSIPYAIAAVLHHPAPGADWYAPGMVRDPKVLALARRVKAGPSPAISPAAGFKMFREGSGCPTKAVTVVLKNGAMYGEGMDCRAGCPGSAPDRERLVERFRIQAAPVLGDGRLEKVIDTLCNVEDVDDIADLAGLLS